jgi:hypothetical protein
MRKHLTKKRFALLAGLTVAGALAVAGYGYFTSTGSGSGSASVGTSTAWAVTTDAATGGPMTPGGGAGTYETIAYHVKNNSTGQQNLANVNVKIANSDGSTWTAVTGCSASDFQLSADGSTWAAAGAAADDTEAAGNAASGETRNGSFQIRMIDSGSSQDGCKSATVPLYLSAS